MTLRPLTCSATLPGEISSSRATIPAPHLLLLGTATARSLGLLDALLVRLDLTTALHGSHESRSCLPWSLELADGRGAEQVHLDEVALESALEGDNRLDQEGVGVLEVDVHDAHHANAHELRLEERTELLEIVCVDRSRHGLGLLGRAHGGWLNVLEHSHVCPSLVSQHPS